MEFSLLGSPSLGPIRAPNRSTVGSIIWASEFAPMLLVMASRLAVFPAHRFALGVHTVEESRHTFVGR